MYCTGWVWREEESHYYSCGYEKNCFLSLWIETKNVSFNWNLMRIKWCIDWSSSQRIRGSFIWSPLPPQSRNAASSSEEPTRGGRWLTLLSNFEVKSVSNRHGLCFGWKRWSKRSIWIRFCCAPFACTPYHAHIILHISFFSSHVSSESQSNGPLLVKCSPCSLCTPFPLLMSDYQKASCHCCLVLQSLASFWNPLSQTLHRRFHSIRLFVQKQRQQ